MNNLYFFTPKKQFVIVVLLANILLISFLMIETKAQPPYSNYQDCYSTFRVSDDGSPNMFSVVDCGPCSIIQCYEYLDSGNCQYTNSAY